MHDRRSCRTAISRVTAAALTAYVLTGFVHCGRADDVEWLSEVNAPVRDAEVPTKTLGRIEPLLVDSDGKPIETHDGWKRKRATIRAAWMEFLGPMPKKRPKVVLKTLETELLKDFTRTLVEYDGEVGQRVQGYLLVPKGEPPRGGWPGLCALHATTTHTIDQIAGRAGNPSRQLGPKLCRRGFVVFCPRNFLWQDVDDYQQAVARFRGRHPRTLGMHKMLFDAMRGVDVLTSLPDVNAERIGAVGHSLGAKEVLYLTAFDDRVRAGVASEGGLGFRSTNWNAPWYLGKAIDDPDFPLNHHQLLALIAPRPFLVLGGESGRGAADGDRSWPLVEPAIPVYELHGKPSRVGLFNHRRGHDIPDVAFERMAEWLEVYLAGSNRR